MASQPAHSSGCRDDRKGPLRRTNRYQASIAPTDRIIASHEQASADESRDANSSTFDQERRDRPESKWHGPAKYWERTMALQSPNQGAEAWQCDREAQQNDIKWTGHQLSRK